MELEYVSDNVFTILSYSFAQMNHRSVKIFLPALFLSKKIDFRLSDTQCNSYCKIAIFDGF